MKLRIQRDIICTNKTYFKHRVKILLRKYSYEVSNLAFLSCIAGSPHQSVSPSPNSPLILNTFPLSDLDETSYINSFWDGICDVCISFFRNSPPLPKLPMYIQFGMAFVTIAYFFRKFLPPLSKNSLPLFPKTIGSIFFFHLSNLDETSCIYLLWDGNGDYYFFFLEISPPPPPSHIYPELPPF